MIPSLSIIATVSAVALGYFIYKSRNTVDLDLYDDDLLDAPIHPDVVAISKKMLMPTEPVDYDISYSASLGNAEEEHQMSIPNFDPKSLAVFPGASEGSEPIVYPIPVITPPAPLPSLEFIRSLPRINLLGF